MGTIIFIIIVLLGYSIQVTYMYLMIKKENAINYSNYQNCLMALSTYDHSLAEYLKEKNKRTQK